MRVWRDEFVDGKHIRKQQLVRLAAATVPEREVKKIASEYLRPLNQTVPIVPCIPFDFPKPLLV